MKITDIGDGLSILLTLDYSSAHNWMGFVSWYSISKNLPNSKIYISCNRKLMNYDLFGWARRVQVPFSLHKQVELDQQIAFSVDKFKIETPLLVVSPEYICVRGFEETENTFDFGNKIYKINEEFIASDCKDNISTVFVSYLQGWGKFVTSDWIHNDRHPLLSGFNFSGNFLNVNEVRLGKIFEEASLLFNKVTKV